MAVPLKTPAYKSWVWTFCVTTWLWNPSGTCVLTFVLLFTNLIGNRLIIINYWYLFSASSGLSSAAGLGSDPDPGGRGPPHHAAGPEPSPAAVGPARVRVRGAGAGLQPESHRAAL